MIVFLTKSHHSFWSFFSAAFTTSELTTSPVADELTQDDWEPLSSSVLVPLTLSLLKFVHHTCDAAADHFQDKHLRLASRSAAKQPSPVCFGWTDAFISGHHLDQTKHRAGFNGVRSGQFYRTFQRPEAKPNSPKPTLLSTRTFQLLFKLLWLRHDIRLLKEVGVQTLGPACVFRRIPSKRNTGV